MDRKQTTREMYVPPHIEVIETEEESSLLRWSNAHGGHEDADDEDFDTPGWGGHEDAEDEDFNTPGWGGHSDANDEAW